MSTPAVRSRGNDNGDEQKYEGLEVCDRVQPDVSDLVVMMPGCTLNPDDTEHTI